MSDLTSKLDVVLSALANQDLELSDFIIGLLSSQAPAHHQAIREFTDNIHEINACISDSGSTPILTYTPTQLNSDVFEDEITALITKSSGFHFGARSMTEQNLREISIPSLAKDMSIKAPCLWNLLDVLMTGNNETKRRRRKLEEKREEKAQKKPERVIGDGDVEMRDPSEDDVDTTESSVSNDVTCVE